VLARAVRHDEDVIRIEDYYVVNGCQSLNSLYDHRSHISPDLRLLAKFIQVEAGSTLAELITANSNNQNGVKARDFKSNHPIQARLQREFIKHYGRSYALAVKRGEPINSEVTISNEVAGLMLIALLGKYVLTNYVMLLTVRKILDLSEAGRDMIAQPQHYVRREADRARFRATLGELIALLIIDLDFETKELPEDFDYRDKLREKDYVSSLVKT
jgi:hypothetical protein